MPRDGAADGGPPEHFVRPSCSGPLTRLHAAVSEQSGRCDCPHFTDEKMEAERGARTCSKSQSR